MTDSVLSIRNLSVSLPKSGDRPFAVENLSLELMQNEVLCIVGESGSGKSVTAFAAMGLLPPALKAGPGEIHFDGRDVLRLTEAEHRRMRGDRMSMIFQEPMTALHPCYTVGEQIEEVFQTHRKMSRRARRSRSIGLLKEVLLPEPERLYHSFPHQLSGGQRQRVMIAMALALDPKLLIADEPTTALDVTTQSQILKMITELALRHGTAVLFVTHDFDVVADIADKVLVMRHGKCVEHGPADRVLNRPGHEYTQMLISSVPRRNMRDLADLRHAETVMKASSVQKSFHTRATFLRKGRTVHAVRDANFSVRRGETVGIVGESGSGKSTLVRCLIRLIDPDDGQIIVGDVDFASMSASAMRAYRKDIQIVFQDPYGSLNPRRTIGDLMIEGPLNFGVPRAEALERAASLLKIVRLGKDSLHRFPAQFSGGQRQRICIARALMMEPKVLIADEAVSALDVSVQKEVLNLLRSIRDDFGLTILFITHDLRVAAQVCDSILVMKDGEIVERGTVDEVFDSPQNPYTQALLEAQPGKNWVVPDFEGASID